MARYRFVRRGGAADGIGGRFGDVGEASAFLRDASTDPDTLQDLRLWAHERGYAQRRDRHLLDTAAAHLVSGELRVAYQTKPPKRVAGTAQAGEAAPEAETKQQQPAPRQTGSGSGGTATVLRAREPEPEPPTPQPPAKPVIDISQQIATLLSAALNGTPFCEQCDKSKSEPAQ